MTTTIPYPPPLYGWWLNVDLEIRCVCGETVHFSDFDITKTCDGCGRPWTIGSPPVHCPGVTEKGEGEAFGSAEK